MAKFFKLNKFHRMMTEGSFSAASDELMLEMLFPAFERFR